MDVPINITTTAKEDVNFGRGGFIVILIGHPHLIQLGVGGSGKTNGSIHIILESNVIPTVMLLFCILDLAQTRCEC